MRLDYRLLAWPLTDDRDYRKKSMSVGKILHIILYLEKNKTCLKGKQHCINKKEQKKTKSSILSQSNCFSQNLTNLVLHTFFIRIHFIRIFIMKSTKKVKNVLRIRSSSIFAM